MTEKMIETKIWAAVESVLAEVRQAQKLPAVQEPTRKSFSGTVDALVLTQVQRTATALGMNFYEAYEEAFRLFLRASRMYPEQPSRQSGNQTSNQTERSIASS